MSSPTEPFRARAGGPGDFAESAGPVAILGLGLIGGSLALALKQAGWSGPIIGWDRPEVLRRARERGAVDGAAETPAAAASRAAFVVLALPVGAILDVLPAVVAAAAPGTVITDTGSTKRRVVAAARAALAGRAGTVRGIRVIGGHPMAGREVGGFEHARADLFAGSTWIFTPAEQASAPGGLTPAAAAPAFEATPETKPETGPETTPEATAGAAAAPALEALVARVGARPLWTDAATHDAALARLSHLPQLLSTALAGHLGERFAAPEWAPLLGAAGPGARDMARLALSPYAPWRDILLTNGDEIAAALEEARQSLDHLRRHLGDREMESAFTAAAAAAQKIRER